MRDLSDTDPELQYPMSNHGSVGHSSVQCPLKPCIYHHYHMCIFGKDCRQCHGHHQLRDHSPKSQAKSFKDLKQGQRAQLKLRVLIGKDDLRTIPSITPLATTTPVSSASFLNQMD